MPVSKKNRFAFCFCLTLSVVSLVLLVSCGGASNKAAETEFAVKDLREIQGNRVAESLRVDNSVGTQVLFSDIGARRDYRHLVNLTLTSDKLNAQTAQDRIYQYYDIAQKDNSKICNVPAEVPPQTKYKYDLEWIEILHEGVLEEGKTGGGQQLGTYEILISWNCQVVGVSVDGAA
jgi:hypothetical protein